MSSVDSRIVTMKFDNSTFQKGVTSTMSLLEKLKTAVTGLPSNNLTLGKVNAGNGRAELAQLSAEADKASGAFSSLKAVAIGALAGIGYHAGQAAVQMAKSFTVAPILQGFEEYELKLGSVQSILANTKGESLKSVTAALEELNEYSDKTIYNFGEMVSNIKTFTVAGIDLDTSVASVQGLANVAALTGTNATDAARATYQMAQAMSTGEVRLQDWISMEKAGGMAGKIFQDSLIRTAEVHGVNVDDMIKKNGNFRLSLQEGWLSTDILTETLGQYAGAYSKAQLAQMGYSDAQIKAIQKLQKESQSAAQDVKTFSALMDTLKETIGSGWAQSFELVFGNLKESTKLWTGVSEVIGGAISASAEARNSMLKDWAKLGGRAAAIEGVGNIFKALVAILKPVRDAFRDVFPPMTGERLAELSKSFRDFTENLIASEGTMDGIQSIFRAIFGVLGVGLEIVKGVARYFISFIGLLSQGAGPAVKLSGSLAEIVAQLTDWILAGDYISKFFDKIIAGRAALLGPIIRGLGEILNVLAGWVGTGAEAAIDAISSALAYLTPYLPIIAENLRSAGDAVRNYLVAGFEKLTPVLKAIKDAIGDALGSLSGIGGSVGGAFGGLGSMFDIGDSADKAAAGIGKVKDALTGAGDAAGGGIMSGLSALGDFLKGFGKFIVKIGGGIVMGIGWLGKEIFNAIGDVFSGGAQNLSAVDDFLGNIVERIKNFFSNIDLTDVAVFLNLAMQAVFTGALAKVMVNFGGLASSIKGTFNALTEGIEGLGGGDTKPEAIMKLAISLGILAAAAYVLSTIDGEALAKSLGGLAAMMIMVSTAVVILEKTMPDDASFKSAAHFASLSFVMLGLGLALLALALALRVISKLDPEELKTGLLTLGAVLGGIVAATAILNKVGGAASLIQASIAIGILAFSLTMFAGALKLYSSLDLEMLAEGGAKIAAIVAGLGLAFRAFPAQGAIAASAAMLIASGALVVLGYALKKMAEMDAGDSWQSVLTLGGALLVLSMGVNSMNGAMLGAAAMLLVAAALAIFVPVLLNLGRADISTIAQGLIALSIAFLVFGGIGYLVGKGLILLGGGMMLLGAGMALAGAGMLAFSLGVTYLSSTGVVAMRVFIAAINNFLKAAPEMAANFRSASVSWARAIASSSGAWAKTAGKIVRDFLREVIKSVPLLGKTFRVLINEGLKTIESFVPKFIRLGFKILNSFMNGLMQNIEGIARKGVMIAVRFIDGVASRSDQLVSAGRRLVQSLGRAIGSEIGNIATGLVSDMKGIAGDMIGGMVSGINAGINKVESAVRNLAGKIPGPIKKLLGISSPSKVLRKLLRWVPEGMRLGLRDGEHSVEREAEILGRTTRDVLTMAMNDVHDALAIDPNLTPTIAPVLDLTQMAEDASKIGTMLDTQPLQATVSYSAASSLASEIDDNNGPDDGPESGGDVTFVQNLHSPRALDSVTIYRSTRNQLSMAKEALKK